ncbi:MAG: S8 family serine peptidase [Pelagimonas sp.]|jgi:hypothetical protein|nr:S8 family serine peptidase [Pelagimonas sp.]
MSLKWRKSDHSLPPNTSAYSDWYQQMGDPPQDTDWTPAILILPPFTKRTERKAEIVHIIQRMFEKRKAGNQLVPGFRLTANTHDLWHWFMTASAEPGIPSELVFLYRAQPSDSARLASSIEEVLNAQARATPELKKDPEARFSLGAIGTPISAASVQPRSQSLEAGVKSADLQISPRMTDGPRQTAPDTGRKVVVTAIIDHGIPFLHERFRTAEGKTRLASYWSQAGVPNAPGPSYLDVVLGQTLEGDEIDSMLTEIEQNGRLSESDIYTSQSFQSALQDPIRAGRRGEAARARSITHGAQMLDIAAGDAPGSARDADHLVLAVDLPPHLVARTNGFLHEPYVKSALNWIEYQVTFNSRIDPGASVVVNYSFNDHCGRRDGQDILDADFQLRLERGAREQSFHHAIAAICVPAGNSYIDDAHCRMAAQDLAGGQSLDLWVPPASRTPVFVQIWLDRPVQSLPFALEISPPGGSPLTALRLQTDDVFDLTHEAQPEAPVVARVSAQVHTPAYPLPQSVGPATARSCVTLALMPTQADTGKAALAPAGRWRVRFSQKADDPPASLDIWIERNDSIAGTPPLGRQAYFARNDHQVVDPDTGRPMEEIDTGNPISRRGTVGALANAADVIVAGAYRGTRAPSRLPAYSSAGPGHSAEGGTPFASFPAEASDAHQGRLTGGTLSGSTAQGGGTSAAAALAARAAADVLRANPQHIGQPGAGAFIRATLAANAAQGLDGDNVAPLLRNSPEERLGHGLVDPEFTRSVPRF